MTTALDKILKNIDVIKLLNHYGFDITHQEGNMLRSKCAIHGGDNPTAFVMNLDNTLWYCHSDDCGGGDIVTLVEKMEGYTGQSSFPKAIRFLADFFDVDISNLEIVEHKDRNKKELEEFIKLMKRRKKKDINEYEVPSNAKPIAKFRDFKSETLQHFGVAFVDLINLEKKNGEKYTLRDRILFPITFNGKVVGISLRRIKFKDVPKWSHQPVHLEVGNILYNYDNVIGKECVVVCEGIVDVMAFYEIGIPAVCTFGANITDKQYYLLIKTGADLVFAYDGDKAGIKATNKAIEMFKNKANISVIEFSEGKDPENISRKELLELYERRKRYYY